MFEFYKLEDKTLSFKPLRSPGRDKCAIISFPKAGTYLVGRLVSQLGFIDLEIHVNEKGFDDYRGKTITQKQQEYLRYSIALPLDELKNFIHAGQFIVGHIPHSNYARNSLREFKKIFLYRDLRDVAVSHMRFLSKTGRGGDSAAIWRERAEDPDKLFLWFRTHGDQIFGMCNDMLNWKTGEEVLKIKFEDVCNKEHFQRVVVEICNFLRVGIPSDMVSFCDSVLEVETLTYSGSRTNRRQYWDQRVQRAFEELGGAQLNEAMGYS